MRNSKSTTSKSGGMIGCSSLQACIHNQQVLQIMTLDHVSLLDYRQEVTTRGAPSST